MSAILTEQSTAVEAQPTSEFLATSETRSASETPTTSPRLMSLDALRGFDMLWIVGGAGVGLALSKMASNPVTDFLASQMTHSQWEGFTFYDLIFPLFLFIVGVSLVLSIDKSLREHGTLATVHRALRRTLLMFAFGVFYMGGLTQRWPEIALGGVLHRIAACYFLSVLIYVLTRDVRGIAVICLMLLVSYWGMLKYIPIPDLDLGKENIARLAAEIGDESPFAIAASVEGRVQGRFDEGHNVTNYVDFLYLPGRKYGPGVKTGMHYISEGLLSTLPATVLTLFGILAGKLLVSSHMESQKKCGWLFAAGVASIALGMLWSFDFPIIKRIWTSSFILFSGGLSAILLSVFYWIIDVKGWRTWCCPLVWVGSNALTIYLLYPVVQFPQISERLVGGDIGYFFDSRIGAGTGALLVAVVGVLLAVWLTRLMYVHKIFLRL